MKKTLLLLLTSLTLSFYSNAQTWEWTHPEPNGDLGANSEHDAAHDIEIDASGNTYVLGDFMGSLYLNNNLITNGYGSYLAKYNPAGSLLWYRLFVPTNYVGSNDYPNSIRATDLVINATGIFITGRYVPGPFQGYDCTTNTPNPFSPRTYSIGSLNFASAYNDIGYFLTKMDTNGNIVWNKTGTQGDYCSNDGGSLNYHGYGRVVYNPLLTSDASNNIIAAFICQTDLPSISISSNIIPLSGSANSNSVQIVVVKFNSDGVSQWSNYAYDAKQPYTLNDCNSIITDNNGNVFLYGIANDSCVFGSNIFHTNWYQKNGENSWSNFLAKIASSGSWQFVKEVINTGSQIWSGRVGNPDLLAVDNLNSIYCLSNYRGNSYGSYPILFGDTIDASSTNTYLSKLDNAGNLIWHKGFATNDTYANSIHYANNSLYISGGIRNYTAVGDKKWYFSTLTVKPTSNTAAVEYFVSKANTNGDFQWVTSFSGQDGFMESFAVKTMNDNVYNAGYYRGSIETLGNLNGSYSPAGNGIENLFFGKLKDQYIRVGALSAKQVIPGCTITIPFTSTGLTFSATNKFTAELSNASGDFTTPTALGNVTSTGTGSITATIPNYLSFGTSGYLIRIKSSDTLKTGYPYYAYVDTGYAITIVCSPAPTGLTTTNISGTSAKLNWLTVPCAAGYKMHYRVKGTSTWIIVPVNSNTGTLTRTGLLNTTTYEWQVATKCTSGGTTSYSAYSAIKEFTTLPGGGGTLEAEDAVLSGAVVASNQPGYTGSGFADYVHASGDYIEWTVNAATAGSYSLQFRYANGGTTSRPLKLEVNGVVVNASLGFSPTGNFATWSVSSATASLIAGTNKVRLTTIGSNGPNVDNLKVDMSSPCQSGTLEAEQAVLNGAIVASNRTGFTGSGFADYVNASGDFIEWTVNALAAGSFTLQFRYANGGATDRPLKLEVNGALVNASLAFTPTTSWTVWSVSSATASLIAGTNKIRLTTTGSNGGNVDNLTFSCNNSTQSLQRPVSAKSFLKASPGILKAYAAPNPVEGGNAKLIVSTSSNLPINLELVDITGRTYKSFKFVLKSSNTFDFPVNDLAPGAYTIILTQGSLNTHVKLIVGK